MKYETAISSILQLSGALKKSPATTASPTAAAELRLASAALQINSYRRLPLTLTILKAPDAHGNRESQAQTFRATDWQDVSQAAALASAEGGDIFVSPAGTEMSPYVYFSDLDRRKLITILTNGERLALDQIIETSSEKYSIAFDLGEAVTKEVRLAAYKLVSDEYNINAQAQQIRVAGFANRDKSAANAQGQAPYCVKRNLSDLAKTTDGGDSFDSTSTPAPNNDLLIAARKAVMEKRQAEEAAKRKDAIADALKLRSGFGYGESPISLYPIAYGQKEGEGGCDGKHIDVLVSGVMTNYGFSEKQVRNAIGSLSPEAASVVDEIAYLDDVLKESAKRELEAKAKNSDKNKAKTKKQEHGDDSMNMK